MGQFRIKTIQYVRTGILRNLQWLITEYNFKKNNDNSIPEISKGSVVVKSGYGPGEYWMSFVNNATGEKFNFEYLWNIKNSGLNESERKQMWLSYFGEIGEEIDSEEYMTEKIKNELKFIISEKPELFFKFQD